MQPTTSLSEIPGLLMGWPSVQTTSHSFGFSQNVAPNTPHDAHACAVTYNGEGHLMTIAPTGAGKGVSCVVPAILLHQGPIVVLDIKGENHAMTHRRRTDMGSKVVCIDPFGIVDKSESDTEVSGFNLFDLLPYLAHDHETACRSLADLLVSADGHKSDPFWRDAAVGVIAGLIDCYNSFSGPMRSISALIHDLNCAMPDATSPGQIPHQQDLTSRLHAQPDLHHALKKAYTSPSDIWEFFQEATLSYRWRPGASDITAIVEMAAKDAMAHKTFPMSAEEEKEAIDRVVARAVGRQYAQDRFVALVAKRTSLDAQHADALWDLCKKCETARSNSLTDLSKHNLTQDLPEDYPLAMHRVAAHPSTLCRSAASVGLGPEKTWGSILTTIRVELAAFNGDSIARTFSATNSLDMESLRRGDDISLYIAFPPARLQSHRTIFRAMIEGILSVIMARTHAPHQRTLFVLDEIAQLGHMPMLLTAQTLLRGYGVQVWSFWQDIAQIKGNYPKDWQTLMNNARVVQAFGRPMGGLTSDLCQALDVPPGHMATLDPQDMLVWMDGQPPVTVRRAICHADEGLRAWCDANPLITKRGQHITPLPPRKHTTTTSTKADEGDVLQWILDMGNELAPKDLTDAEAHSQHPHKAPGQGDDSTSAPPDETDPSLRDPWPDEEAP